LDLVVKPDPTPFGHDLGLATKSDPTGFVTENKKTTPLNNIFLLKKSKDNTPHGVTVSFKVQTSYVYSVVHNAMSLYSQ
jgi:hypothetical protein